MKKSNEINEYGDFRKQSSRCDSPRSAPKTSVLSTITTLSGYPMLSELFDDFAGRKLARGAMHKLMGE
jgi:hypothetical protein